MTRSERIQFRVNENEEATVERLAGLIADGNVSDAYRKAAAFMLWAFFEHPDVYMQYIRRQADSSQEKPDEGGRAGDSRSDESEVAGAGGIG